MFEAWESDNGFNLREVYVGFLLRKVTVMGVGTAATRPFL